MERKSSVCLRNRADLHFKPVFRSQFTADNQIEVSLLTRPTTRAEWYIVTVFALGAVAFTLAPILHPITDPVGLAIVVGLAAMAESLSVRLHHDGRVSVSSVGVVVGAVSFGPSGAVLVASAIAITGWLAYSRREKQKLIFNFGQHNIAAFIAAVLVTILASDLIAAYPLAALGVGAVVGVGLFAMSSAAVTAVMCLTAARRPIETYRSNFAWLVPHYAAFGVVAGGISAAHEVLGVIGLVSVSLPLVLSRYSIKQAIDRTRDNVIRLEKSNEQLQGAFVEIRSMTVELRQAYTGTLESLVTALDVRDQETRGHSVRVATHSLDIAHLLGMSEQEELDTIYRGALMHDVGKIGIPDNILLKPGKLTEEEWEFMRRHSAMGYRILAQVPYLRPTAKIVLAHHERWDGEGYPRRLKAENIPLGARIFAICDTYDAIISDRPYRQGQSPEAAFAEILRCAGSQFDPKVVEAFEAAFPRWQQEDGTARRPPLYLPAHLKQVGEERRKAAG
jgi:HD domain